MERLIVFALFCLLPSQLASHFWLQSSYIYGLRVDYLAPSIYLTDILIILLLPYLIKSIKNTRSRNNTKPINTLKTTLVLFSIICFAVLNIIFAQVPLSALVRWLVILKMVFLGLYIYYCDLNKLKKTIISALSFSLIAVFLIGLLQFTLQKTIGGPLYLLGERSFTSFTPGIALMNLFGKSMMRAYSTFPHPNSFAGFVVVAFLIVISFFTGKEKKFISRNSFLFVSVILSLLITMSLNALIVVFLVSVLFFTANRYPIFVSKIKVYLPIVLISFSLLFGAYSLFLFKNNLLTESYNTSYRERLVLAANAITAFSGRPVLGVGLNNFFYETKNTQPVHNIYLITLCECGIAGVLLFYLSLLKLFDRKINTYLFLAITFVLITGFFDHYWFTLQQNQLLLAVLVGLSLRKYNIIKYQI